MSRHKILDRVTEYWVPGYLFLMMVGALDHNPRFVSDVAYAATLIFLIGGAGLFLRRGGSIPWRDFSALPFCLFAIWTYGVLLGLVSGTAPGMVFRNFAGMALFPFVYGMMVLLKPNPRLLVGALMLGSVGFVYMVTYLLLTVNPQGTVDSIGLMTFRYHYYLATIPAIAVMLLIAGRAVVFRDGNQLHFLLAPAIFVCMFYSGSRAFYAALAVTMLFLGVALIPRWSLLIRATLLGIGFLMSGLFLAMLSSGGTAEVGQAVAQSIEMEIESGSPRSQQLAAMLPELNLFGHGLGAALGSGYARDPIFTYAFELSYISLAHKVGFLGLLAFLACVAVHMAQSLRALIRSDFKPEMIIAVSVMGFLVSSWWNPALFAPLFVVLFCASIYLRQATDAQVP
ncbi:hypothetical protein PSC71_08450 [Devosia sp. J2-20]|uniref:hypothetical protein n=1 Tax=Devosia sp. J2-20 TaxID=3026161 RepID=UPI00249A4FFE|nr:hypothetical protein [Devosia sp. J2-20]WDR00764.1 hypothetical protein PSC71_08450 [Devosia sp. J2-20]